MKIFVTNLTGFDKRKNWMRQQLKRLNLSFDFIDCIDGRNWDDAYVEKITSPGLYSLYKQNNSWLTKGAIAATKTHLDLIYNEIINENYNYALCLEDDVILDKNFNSILRDIERQLIKNRFEGVLLLHYFIKEKIKINELKSYEEEDTEVKIYHCPKDLKIVSGAAYIISKNAAMDLVNNQKPISRIADWWHDHPNLKLYFLYPITVYTGMFESTLVYKKSFSGKFISKLLPKFIKNRLRIYKLKKRDNMNIEHGVL